MKELASLVPNLTMSTSEVAELTGKLVLHINRDVVAMVKKLEKAGEDVSGAEIERDSRNYIKSIRLDRELAFTLVTGYDVVARRRLVRRFSEMEEAVATTGSFAAERWYNVEDMVCMFYERTNSRKKPLPSAARDRLFNLRNSQQVAWRGGNPNELEPSQFFVREDSYLLAMAIMFDDITRFHTDWISNRSYILGKLRVYDENDLNGVHGTKGLPPKQPEPPVLSEEEQWRRLIEED